MSHTPKEQAKFYKDYWLKIEQLTGSDLSAFIRDFLSIKQHKTPRIDSVYPIFKEYAAGINTETLLEQILHYARIYNQIINSNTQINKQIDACLRRLNQLEITVVRSFLMEVLSLNKDNSITNEDVLKIFTTVESYIFRRYICRVPINALSKLFAAIDYEIRRYDDTNTNNYYDKFVYAITSRTESVRYPNDEEFKEQIGNIDAYNIPTRYRLYIFERYENFGTIETKDIYEHIKSKDYTIEHIMPQQLTPAWEKSLGENAHQIHSKWLHRLSNLTITAYNSKLSNKPFIEKRDSTNGYKQSGLRINNIIAQQETWAEQQLIERSNRMTDRAIEIWPKPNTTYQPQAPELPSCTLADENINLTNKKIARYSYKGNMQTTDKWSDMFEQIITLLHANDSTILTELAYSIINKNPDNYFSNTPDILRQPQQIDDNIYIEKNTSTTTKLTILRQLFDLYGIEHNNLVFYYRNKDKN